MSRSIWLIGGGDPEPPSFTIRLKNGQTIPCYTRDERPPAALWASLAEWKKLHPQAIPRSISATYNCIGLIVANRRGHVDPDLLIEALQGDGYHRLAGLHEARQGDVVVYRDDKGDVQHAGFVWELLLVTRPDQDHLQVLSKWGADGEYFHLLSDVPIAFGKATEGWTDRQGV